MSSTRQSDRPDPARRRPLLTPQLLESRQLLSTAVPSYLSLYTPSDLYVTNPITHQRIPFSARNLMQHNNPNSPLLSNQGKIVSGTTRDGTQWTITVHGPGQVIVTDTTPNDGALDDDIATIQIINSNPRTTYVTGTTVASNQVLSDGTVNFNRLIALGGVKSIELNGFNLTANVTPAVSQSPGIFLYGGVQRLSLHDILAPIDTSVNSMPYKIVIGDPSTPLTVKPSIYLDSIYNSVFDGTSTQPLVTVGPNVNITKLSGNQAESTISINPTNPLNLFESDTLSTQGHFSTDGGTTWQTSNMSALPPSIGDVQTTWDSFGNLFLTQLGPGLDIIVARSSDGGATFKDVRTVVTASSNQPSIAVGPSGVAGIPEAVWISVNSTGNAIVAAGAPVSGFDTVGAFGAPVTLPGSSAGDFGSIAIGPNGQVMVNYQSNLSGNGPDTIRANLDPDGLGPSPFGGVFTITSTNVGGFSPIPAQPIRTIDAEANLAWDRSGGPHNGRVYMVYTDRPSTSSVDTTIDVRFSDDNGTTWSAPTRVNDDPLGNGKSQFLPAIAVDQVTGDVAVTWYDTRNSGAANNTTQVFGSASLDGGATWLPNVQISAGISNASAVDPNFDYGDYDLMDFNNGVFYRTWVDNSNSTGDNPNGTGALDIYTAKTGVRPPPPIPTGPLTTPTVQFSINGVVQNFSIVSTTQSPIPPTYLAQTNGGTATVWSGVPASGPVPPAYQFFYNIVGTTGRTTLQALAVNHLNVVGKATNFTAQRDTTLFGSSLTGMKYIRRATFGGNADAVALDVNGPIGKVTFKRGLGDPTGVFNGKVAVPKTGTSRSQRTQYIPATNYGVPLGSEGYPAHGLLGGVIRAKRIGTVKVGPANYITQTAQNPNFVQLQQNRSPTYYLVNPGTALTNSAITTDGSIGKVQVTGNQLNSEIKTGFDYPSYIAGLQGTRSPSRIRLVRQRGDLVSSVDSATVRPTQNSSGNFVYSTATNVTGSGSITGTATAAVGHGRYAASYSKVRYPGLALDTGGRTALGNYGAGFFARRRSRNLPPHP